MRTISGLSCLLLLIAATPLTQSQSSPQNSSDAKAPTVYSQVPQANVLYIQGLDYLSKSNTRREGGSLVNAREAVRLFSQAVKKDPQFALAYLGLADAWDCFGFSIPGSVPAVKLYPHEVAAALRAEKLDDNLPSVHSLLASLYSDNAYDWENAEREYKRVISMTNSVASHSGYATFLATQGRFEEAITEVKLAEKIDPSSPSANKDMMEIYYWRHQDDQALQQGRELLRKAPQVFYAHFIMGFAYVHKGEFENAIREFKLSTVRGDAGSLSGLGYAYAMSGNKAETQNVLLRLKHHSGAKNVPYRRAAIYLALGDRDRAIKLIEKDYRQRSNWLNRLNVDPVMDPLRDDPRFKDLMRKMNFQRDARDASANRGSQSSGYRERSSTGLERFSD
jgi:tetratricopeptide (TPR) repeat protein